MSCAPPVVVARYDYSATAAGELSMKKGEKLILIDDSRPWWRVQNGDGHCGIVPSNYVKRAKPGIFSTLKNTFGGNPKVPTKSTNGNGNGNGNGAAKGFHTLQHTKSEPGGVIDSINASTLDRSVALQKSAAPNKTATTNPNPTSIPNITFNHFPGSAPSAASVPNFPVITSTVPIDHTRSDSQETEAARSKALPASPNVNSSRSLTPGPTLNGFGSANASIGASAIPPLNHLGSALVKFDYMAQKPDELSLRKNDLVFVLEKSSDGWWRVWSRTNSNSTSNVNGPNVNGDSFNGRSGWFPHNYLAIEGDDDYKKLSKSNPNLANSHFYTDPAEAGADLNGFDPRLAPQTLMGIGANAFPNVPAANGPRTTSSLPPDPNPTGIGLGLPANKIPSDVLFYIVTLYKFARQNDIELSFEANEYLEVIEQPADDPDWWRARNIVGEIGLVPKNYVQVSNPPAQFLAQSLARPDPHDQPLPDLPPNFSRVSPASNATSSTNVSSSPMVSKNGHRSAGMPMNGNGTGSGTDRDRPTLSGTGSGSATGSLQSGMSGGLIRRREEYIQGGPLAQYSWFWGTMPRADSEQMLVQLAQVGQFLVRDCESTPGDLTISVRAMHKTRHFRVHYEVSPAGTNGAPVQAPGPREEGAGKDPLLAGSFLIGQLCFDRMEDLLEHYTRHPIYRGTPASGSSDSSRVPNSNSPASDSHGGEVLYLTRPFELSSK